MFAFLLCARIMMNADKINQVQEQTGSRWASGPGQSEQLLCCRAWEHRVEGKERPFMEQQEQKGREAEARLLA